MGASVLLLLIASYDLVGTHSVKSRTGKVYEIMYRALYCFVGGVGVIK